MVEKWDQMCEIYNHLEDKKCLCDYPNTTVSQNIWVEWYRKCFEVNSKFISEECQMLCISFVGLTGEVYTDCVTRNQYVCSSVVELFKVMSSKDFWNTLVHLQKFSQNRFIIWNLTKSLTVILYTTAESDLSCRISMLLADVKDSIFQEENIHILDLFCSFVEYNPKFENCHSLTDTCKNYTPGSVSSYKDLFQGFLTILSKYWNAFMEQFYTVCASSSQNQSIHKFLLLWQKLVQKHFEEHHVFLNAEFVTAFFSNAPRLNVISLRVYVDIIMQFFFILSFESTPSKERGDHSISEAISVALNGNFFGILPCDIEMSGFSVVTSQSDKDGLSSDDSKDFSKYDSIIAKKVTFICLNGLIGAKNKYILCDVLLKVFGFVKDNFYILPEVPLYSYILDIFMDQDDILFGIMFALLKVYNVLKEEKVSCDSTPLMFNELKNDMNPHLIFISFLKRTGFDHNELLSFLTSDETCFLPYLLQYMKLLLKEKENFVQAHTAIVKNVYKASSQDITEQSIDDLNYSPPAKILLVDYLSSSSSDEEPHISAFPGASKDNITVNLKDLVALNTLVSLKGAIQKLVDLKEFPYNALPLLSMLSACEELSSVT